LLLGKYGVIFEYFPGKKTVGTVTDTLFRFDIDNMKNSRRRIIRTSLRIRKQQHQ
jgi:hypothetical protein